jgi:hypothetical protein
VATSVIDRNHTLKFVIHGACPVIFGIVALDVVVNEWARLGLYNSTRPTCTVLPFGGPSPPPSTPPPPSIPPARVLVEAFVTLELDQSGLSLEASAAFTTAALDWARARVAQTQRATSGRADSAALTKLTVVEGSTSTIAITLDDPSQLEPVLTPLQAAGHASMCNFAEMMNCDVSAVLPSPPPFPPSFPPPSLPPAKPPPPMVPTPTASGTRRLQQVMSAPPPPRPTSGQPNASMLYLRVVNLIVDRSFVATGGSVNATSGSERLNRAIAAQSGATCPATAVSCPTVSLRSSSVEASTLTVLRADISLVVLANRLRDANRVAADIFQTLFDTSALVQSLSHASGVNISISISSLYAQYLHPRLGLIIIRGSLPPPPPAPAPATDPGAKEITTTVTTVVAAAIGAAIGGAVAGSAAGTSGASSGATSGGVAPLIFGVQRFSASSGLAANLSKGQTGVADGMGWASGSFSFFGGGASNDDSAATASRRRLAIWLARRLVGIAGNANSSSNTTIKDVINLNFFECLQAGGGGGAESRQGSRAQSEEEIAGCEHVPDALVELFKNLLSFFIAIPVIFLLQLLVLTYWKKRANRAYYEQKEKAEALVRRATDRQLIAVSTAIDA